MVNKITKFFSSLFTKKPDTGKYMAVDDLGTYGGGINTIFNGDKFFGGFGATELQYIDYWELRHRSGQLFNDNLYARGLIRRLITNEINTGLTPECFPDEKIIGVPDDSLQDWSEMVENRFHIYGKSPKICDWKQVKTFGALQRAARAEALVSGDLLVVLRQSKITNLPMVQLVSGNSVQTPLAGENNIRKDHSIVHGVELDINKRVVAHWVKQDDGSSKRIPAFGEKSGRRISWLVYGTDKRLDEVRGQPLLALILQSLKEIDRYRDAAQRKAVINSILAMFVKKTEDKMSTLPITGGAVRRDQASVTDGDGTVRNFNLAGQIPGLVMEELQTGEEPVGFGNQGTDINFGVFESSIIQAIAWANEMPPEILQLAFTDNYSASQAAINEFKIYLTKVWSDWGETFCSPIQQEWLINEVLLQKIDAPGLLKAWRDPRMYDIFGAWVNTEWYGVVKLATDAIKQAKGSKMQIDECWSTNAREARTINGSKFTKNAKRIKRENELKVEAMRPMAEFQAQFNVSNDEPAGGVSQDKVDTIADMIIESLEEKGVRL